MRGPLCLWFVKQGALPIRKLLNNTHILIDDYCLLCEKQEEMVLHFICDYNEARQIWKLVVHPTKQSDLYSLIEYLA